MHTMTASTSTRSTRNPKKAPAIVKATDKVMTTAEANKALGSVKPEGKVYTRNFKDGSSVTCTANQDGTFTMNGATFSSLSAAANAYLQSKGKKGGVSGVAFWHAEGSGRTNAVNMHTGLARLIEAAKDLPVVKAHLEAALAALPPPIVKTALVTVTLPDGTTAQVRASALRK